MFDKTLVSRLRGCGPRLLAAASLAGMSLSAFAASPPAAAGHRPVRSAGARVQSPREHRRAGRSAGTRTGRGSTSAHRSRRHPAGHGRGYGGHPRRHHGRADFGAPPGLIYGPGVGVSIAPRSEHWGSDYLPDAYRLPDYDGRTRTPGFCRGRSGATITTTGGGCPPGQHGPRRGHALSTRPR